MFQGYNQSQIYYYGYPPFMPHAQIPPPQQPRPQQQQQQKSTQDNQAKQQQQNPPLPAPGTPIKLDENSELPPLPPGPPPPSAQVHVNKSNQNSQPQKQQQQQQPQQQPQHPFMMQNYNPFWNGNQNEMNRKFITESKNKVTFYAIINYIFQLWVRM